MKKDTPNTETTASRRGFFMGAAAAGAALPQSPHCLYWMLLPLKTNCPPHPKTVAATA